MQRLPWVKVVVGGGSWMGMGEEGACVAEKEQTGRWRPVQWVAGWAGRRTGAWVAEGCSCWRVVVGEA